MSILKGCGYCSPQGIGAKLEALKFRLQPNQKPLSVHLFL